MDNSFSKKLWVAAVVNIKVLHSQFGTMKRYTAVAHVFLGNYAYRTSTPKILCRADISLLLNSHRIVW